MNNLFQSTADYYDMDVSSMADHDLAFYVEYARRNRRGVLEIACGTGRVTLPLARAGHRVWGLDLSPAMLAVLERKLRSLPQEVRSRIRVSRANMAEFSLNRTFDLIIIPFRGFQALTDPDDVLRCLGSVRRHLTDDGLFILDVFDPGPDVAATSRRGEQVDWVKRNPTTGETITRTHRERRVDAERQVIHSQMALHISGGGKPDRTLTDDFSLKYYYRHQLEILLPSTGYTVEAEYGYYDKRRIGTGTEFILVCRKSRREGLFPLA